MKIERRVDIQRKKTEKTERNTNRQRQRERLEERLRKKNRGKVNRKIDRNIDKKIYKLVSNPKNVHGTIEQFSRIIEFRGELIIFYQCVHQYFAIYLGVPFPCYKDIFVF